MPFIAFPFESTRIMLDYRSRQYELDYSLQASCMQFLNTYNYNGYGSMPDFDYIIPNNGIKITFKYGLSEVQIDSTSWSSCGPELRKLFRIYHRQFIKKGLFAYSETHGI